MTGRSDPVLVKVVVIEDDNETLEQRMVHRYGKRLALYGSSVSLQERHPELVEGSYVCSCCCLKAKENGPQQIPRAKRRFGITVLVRLRVH